MKSRNIKSRNIESRIEERLLENYETYYRVAYSYVHNEADALDIVQEGAYKAILKSDSVKKPEYIDTWLYRVIVNEALQFLRNHKREVTQEMMEESGSCDEYRDVDLEEAIEQLEPIDQTIIKLRFFEELSISAIAEVIEMNVNSVKSRLYRALGKLKLSLEEN